MSSTEAPSAPTRSRRGRLGKFRARVRSWPGGRIVWRIGVTVVGLVVVAVGVVLLPLPGPGWLIIFAGLGVLGSEYQWAKRLLGWVRRVVRGWTRRLAAKPLWVRLLAGLLTLVLVAGVALAAWFLPRWL
ncbi:MAG: hypothetical protein QOG01_793 [Pseudonocardiales bacterium]|jgi:uncharacterized protein (TIGR02611 family)|nr:hypothetical protein [Pseudonocardiales bacterium]